MCALGEEHTKECDVLSRIKDKKIIEDFTEPSKIYWTITTLRCLHWRKEISFRKYFVDHSILRSSWGIGADV